MAVDSITVFDNAFDILRNLASRLPTEPLAVQAAEGRVLAAPVHANYSLPPFARAMMDGYAIKSADTKAPPRQLQIVDSIQAGHASEHSLGRGEAIRIATGSPMPIGADAVARAEWCEHSEHSEHSDKEVTVLKTIPAGESVQPTGEDGREGDVLLPQGTVLRGEQIAVCQGFGIDTVVVYARPRVRVIVTGDEVAPNPAVPLQPGQIYSVNDAFLRFQLLEDGYDVPIPTFVRDNPAELANALAEAAADAHYVITTGGVSVGHRDYMADVLDSMGARVHLKKVLMRPGSPLIAAQLENAVVFALSGNPAAAFIQFETLVRPTLRGALGRDDSPFPSTAILLHDIDLKPIKPVRILRGQAHISDARVWVDVQRSQSSGVISSLGTANCLIRIDDGHVPANTIVPLRWFRQS